MKYVMLYINRGRLLQALLFFVVLGALASCKKDEPYDPVKQREKDDRLIQEYLQKNSVDMSTVTQTNSGLYYQPLEAGTGAKVESGDKVEVKYKGWFIDDKEFDSNYDSKTPFVLMVGAQQVIPGWDEGLQLMKEGEKARLYIPSRLAYGRYGRNGIPGNSVLIFDVEVVDIQ